MIRAFSLVFVLLAAPAQALVEGWPALYDVMGVSTEDALNVRKDPTSDSPILSTLAHSAVNVEVVRTDKSGNWGLINIPSGTGWVSLRYMQRKGIQSDGEFPNFTACWGTEPFWNIERQDGQLRFNSAFDIAFREPIVWETVTLNHRRRSSFRTDHTIGVISRQYCDDGMSDLENGLEINLILLGKDLHLQGCCSIAPR